MPTLNIIDKPVNHFVSVYDPIKISARLETTLRETYPSVIMRVTPFNTITNEYDYSRQVRIRVPAQPKAPENIDQAGWAATSTLYYSTDLSSICRDFVSFDLRPCTQETNNHSKRDITLSQISHNTFSYVQVNVRYEEINSDGILQEVSTGEQNAYFYPINAAISNEERQGIYFDSQVFNGTNPIQGGEFYYKYTHYPTYNYGNGDKGRQKYLTTKPTKYRWIGEDEVEYLSFITQSSSTAKVYALIRFFDLDGNQLEDSNETAFRLSIQRTSIGDGTHRSSDNALLNSQFTSDDELKAVVQIGVGTRNIAYTDVGWINQNDDFRPMMDFRGISRYEIETRSTETNDDVGETVVYYIEHEKHNIGKTRVHWQNRLGGIDSYTFYDTSIRGLNTSSKTFEQTVYPRFGDQIALSTSNNKYIPNTVELGTGGVIKGDRHAISKSKVKSFKEGQLVSRPINSEAEMDMFNDLMSSPRVWIENGWSKKEIFRDNFDYATEAELVAKWNDVYSSKINLLNPSADHPTVINGKCLNIGDNSGNDAMSFHSKELLPFDPSKLYEFEIRLKRSLGSGTAYFGFVGYAADGVTKINTSGSDSVSSQHYITLSGHDFASQGTDDYATFRGYVRGHNATGAGGVHSDPNDPAFAYDGIKFISPFIIVNYQGETGKTQVDYCKVVEYTSDVVNGGYYMNTLNRHYYTPIVIKDGSMTTFDSNNLTKVTLNYMHSKEEKTIS